MANLLNQNIGTNYKGILNLNTLNGNLSETLQAVTDGSGNTSPLQLSTTLIQILGDTNGSFGLYIKNTNTGTSAGSQLLIYNDAGISAQWYSSSSNAVHAYGANTLFLRQVANGAFRFVSDFNNEFYFGNSLTGLTPYVKFASTLISIYNNTVIGHTSASARLQVRGDGTNPIARFEDNTGTNWIQITYPSGIPTIAWADGSYYQMGGSGRNVYTAGSVIHYGVWSVNNYSWSWQPTNSMNATLGTQKIYNFNGTFASAAGSASPRLFDIAYTINNSGAQTGGATATGIFLNATETALNGMAHNLMDLQVGGSSIFKVSNNGAVEVNSTTQGFLPPRMNDAAVRAIISPAEGLVVYNTDITHLCIFANGSWHRLVHIAM
jgi:hypothetical protein